MEPGRSIQTAAELGALVRAVRIASDLTQAEAAALCGVSGPFLSDLEGGKPSAHIGLVLAVCAGLGIDVRLAPPMAVDQARRRRPRRRLQGPADAKP